MYTVDLVCGISEFRAESPMDRIERAARIKANPRPP